MHVVVFQKPYFTRDLPEVVPVKYQQSDTFEVEREHSPLKKYIYSTYKISNVPSYCKRLSE